jgi:hypothetical protein
MLVLFKATALLMIGTFIIGMSVAFITNELGVLFTKMAKHKEKKKMQEQL